MTDPANIAQLVGTAIHLAEFLIKLSKRIKELEDRRNSAPKTLEHIHVNTPLLVAILKTIEHNARDKSKNDQDRIGIIIRVCWAKARKLDGMLSSHMIVKGDSTFVKTRKACLENRYARRMIGGCIVVQAIDTYEHVSV